MKKQAKVLYFINGGVPSKKDLDLAEKTPGNVCFRNADMDVEGTYIEDADSVMGVVPARYKTKYGIKPTEAEVSARVKPVSSVKWNPNK